MDLAKQIFVSKMVQFNFLINKYPKITFLNKLYVIPTLSMFCKYNNIIFERHS